MDKEMMASEYLKTEEQYFESFMKEWKSFISEIPKKFTDAFICEHGRSPEKGTVSMSFDYDREKLIIRSTK